LVARLYLIQERLVVLSPDNPASSPLVFLDERNGQDISLSSYYSTSTFYSYIDSCIFSDGDTKKEITETQ